MKHWKKYFSHLLTTMHLSTSAGRALISLCCISAFYIPWEFFLLMWSSLVVRGSGKCSFQIFNLWDRMGNIEEKMVTNCQKSSTGGIHVSSYCSGRRKRKILLVSISILGKQLLFLSKGVSTFSSHRHSLQKDTDCAETEAINDIANTNIS